jgi:hypothetical protein
MRSRLETALSAALLVACWAACSASGHAQERDQEGAAGSPPPAPAGPASGVHWLDGPPPAADALRAHPEQYAELLLEQGLVLDFEARSVSARGGTLHDVESLGYPIEYVLVTDRGRTHEALLVIKARPSVLDACLRAVGLVPGSPMRFRLRDDDDPPQADAEAPPPVNGDVDGDVGDDDDSPAMDEPSPWEAVPAYGPLVAIDVAYTDDEGRPHRASLESMLLDLRTGESLPEREWVYVGGRFGPLRQGREVVQVHVADLNGNVVAIYLDGQGLCLFERNSLDGVDDALYTIHPENAPRRGTPVTIVFTATGQVVPPPPMTRDDVLEGELAVALDELLTAAAARGFCGVVQVELAGVPVLRKAYGALAAGGAPLPTDAVFPVEAVGRRLIATAVLDAVDNGALSLDDGLSRHVHGVPPDKAGVTIRHLLEDTSGLPASVPGAETIDRARAQEALLATPLVAEPGPRCLASPAGYALLLIALENATEDVWRGLLGERVLARARMPDAGLWGEPRWEGARLARGTLIRDGRRVDVGTPAERLPTWQDLGAGALVASARDLVRFERALAGGVFPDAAVRFVPPCEPARGVFRVDDGPGGPCRVVGGRREGFRCEVRRWLDADLLLVVASNVEQPDVVPELVARLDAAAAAALAAAAAAAGGDAPDRAGAPPQR